MKLAKRFLTAGVALALTLGLNIPAFAAPLGTGEGSITITNATADENYTIYKIFDTLESGKGAMATEAQKDFYLNQQGNPFTFTSNGTDKYVVGIGTHMVNGEQVQYTDKEVTDFLQSFVSKDGDDEDNLPDLVDGFENVVDWSNPVTATNAEVKFESIPYGYYLVTSSLGAFVTVDSTNPNQQVIDKNQDGGSGFTKTVDGEDEVVEIGEEFDFTLKFQATNYDGEDEITQYVINDTLDPAMDLVYDSAKPGQYGVEVTVGTTKLGAEDFTVNFTENADGDQIEITIPWQEDGEFKYPSPSNVTVTYTTKLNSTASIQENITNSATLTWNDEQPTGNPIQETVQTYALAIMKVDEQGNALSGAEFAVTKDGAPVYVSAVDGENGVYVVDPNSTSNIVVSPESGLIVIKGVDNVQYTLTETKAPAGYNLLDEPETVIPSENGSTTITIYYDENGNVTNIQTEDHKTVTSSVPVTSTVVVNEAGSQLPSTGGMGTTVLYIAGAALVLGAGITLVVRRRMNSDQ